MSFGLLRCWAGAHVSAVDSAQVRVERAVRVPEAYTRFS
jgi:hypothetical protein